MATTCKIENGTNNPVELVQVNKNPFGTICVTKQWTYLTGRDERGQFHEKTRQTDSNPYHR